MTDEQDATQSASGWRPPEPASEATFVPPPPRPAEPATPAWPPPAVAPAAPTWPPPTTDGPATPAWPPPTAGAPGWQPPPAPGSPAWPPPAAGYPPAGAWAQATPPRSTSILVVVAAVFLLVAGLLLLGMGTLLLLGSALFVGADGALELEGMVGGDLAEAFAGILAVVGAVALAGSLLQIVGAFGMLAHRGWGRAIGIVVGVLGLLLWGLSFVAALGAPADAGSSLAFTGIFVAGYGLTVVACVTGGAHFRRG